MKDQRKETRFYETELLEAAQKRRKGLSRDGSFEEALLDNF